MSGIVPLRRQFRVVNGGTPTADEKNWGGDVVWLTPADLSSGAMYSGGSARQLTAEGASSGSVCVPEGSVILSTRAPVGYVSIATRQVAFNQGCKALVPVVESDSRFCYYSLLALRPELNARANGTTFQEISAGSLAELPLPDLPVVEQRRIADYLDEQVNSMNRLEALRVLQIELGVAREASRSAANFERLQRESPAKRVRVVVDESSVRGSDRDILLSVSIHRGVVPRSDLTDDLPRAEDLSRYKRVRAGDIVLNRMRAFQGGIGVASIDGIVSPDYTVMTPRAQIEPEFLHVVFRSTWFVGEMTSRLRGIGSEAAGQVRTPRVNFADLALIKIPVPDRSRQSEFASQFRSRERELVALTASLTRSQTLLAERRQALITAAVTGQLDVTTASRKVA